nr:MAG TPA: hypothetical protein [Caudoviricetes sp.]
MKPAARGLFLSALVPPPKKIQKYPQNICLFEKYIYLCSANIYNQVHGTESRCIFYAHIASIGGVSPRAPPVIGRAHLIKDVSSG